jgi:hypothetical protein
MFAFLAQASSGTNGNLFDSVARMFSRVDTLAHPANMVNVLQQLSVVWAVVFLIAGIVSLVSGYRYYRVVTIVMAACIGAFGGYVVGLRVQQPYVVSGCMALLAAVVCWPLMKYAVAVMGGLAGAFLGANAWSAIAAWMRSSGGSMQYDPALSGHWIGALIGLLFCGMLAFILFKFSAVFFTSVSGATVALIGGLGVLLHLPLTASGITESISHNSVVLPILVVVPAVIGLILQQTQKNVPEPA